MTTKEIINKLEAQNTKMETILAIVREQGINMERQIQINEHQIKVNKAMGQRLDALLKRIDDYIRHLANGGFTK